MEKWENQIFGCGLNSSGQIGHQMHPLMHQISKTNDFVSMDSNSESSGVEAVAPSEMLLHQKEPVAFRVPTVYNYSSNPDLLPEYLIHECRIVMIEAGWYHTLLLDSYGRMFSCGAGYNHQNGHSTTTNMDYFSFVNIGEPVEFIACGGHHSLLITKNSKQIMSFGEGKDGQLGNGVVSCSTPKKVCILDANGRQVRFKYACAGGYHSVVVDENSNVYTFGKGGYGQLGIDIESTDSQDFIVVKPTMIRRFEEIDPVTNRRKIYDDNQIKIVQCSAGAWHTLFVTDSGLVFGSGDTQYGQLSLQCTNSTKFFVPTLIQDLKKYRIITTSCGYFHSAFIAENGQLFTCGWNAYGNCGTGSTATQRHVTKVSLLGPWRIVSVKCGWNHTCCIAENGSVYAFGEIKHGQLPISLKAIESDRDSSHAFTKFPRFLECFEHLPISMVTCGRGHSMFVTGFVTRTHIPGTWTLSPKAIFVYHDVDIITFQ
jgi:alpha-tubulin suppressor-like RCC1 family protein